MSHIALATPGWTQAQATALRMEWFLKFTKPSKDCKIGNIAEGAEDNSQASDRFTEVPLMREHSPLESTAERHELDRQRALKRKAEDEALGELEERLNKEKVLKNLKKAREKKRRQRENKKAGLAKSTNIAPPCTPPTTPVTSNQVDSVTPGPLPISGLAELSRPHRQSKLILSGHNKEEAIVAAKHVNWMNPILFHLIDAAANEVGYPWKPADIAKRLKLQYPQLFEKLWPQRISDWKDGEVKDRLKWKDSVLTAIKSGNHPGGASTRQPILVEYPEMVATLKERLVGLRVTGTPLDTATIRGFMIATISERAPELFERKVSEDKQFRCSSEFIRSFLHNELDWSLRRPTQAAQKVPANVKEVLMKAFLRMACAVRDENIPSYCIVNSDQTQVVYSAGTQYTWHKQGDKQVPVLGKEEKRAFTLLVGVSNDGQLLPLQAIYQGMSSASLPHRNASGYAEAIANHVFFVASMTTTYWSTLQTMKDYVDLILVPYFQRVISIHGLPGDQRCIWQIDVWSVHRSEKFRDWLATNYPWIILQYVPGGCTGLFQACDVGLQKIAKAAIRQRSLADIINETTMALRNGADPTTLVNDKSIGTLRNRSVTWINEAIRAIDKPKLIQKAFALCTVPDTQFNLSYESLTSHEARQAIRQLKTSDPEFHTEITAGRQVVPSSEEDVEPEDGNSTSDELSTADHVRIVMGSATATEVMAQQDALAANQDSDDESTYEPPAPNPTGASDGSGSMPARREIPKRAAKKNTSYTLQEWWNRIDIDN
ncbi:DDE superfamily endonuclease, partial [Rhizoctonia solani AG-3 Rhs1AP]